MERKMKKFILVILMLFMACACTSRQEEIKPANDNTHVVPRPSGKVSSSIIDHLYSEGENVIYSDMSLNIALAMLANGATGYTLTELETLMGMTLADMNKQYGDIISEYKLSNIQFEQERQYCLKELEKAKKDAESKEEDVESLDLGSCASEDEYALNIANVMYADKTRTLKASYEDNLSEWYDALIRSVDFAETEAVAKEINDFVDENTKGEIKDILQAQDLQDATAVLVNTLYFKDSWKKEFKQSDEKENFVNWDGSKTPVNYLYSKEGIYFENEAAEGFAKEYNNGLMFIGVLPKQEGDFNFSSLRIKDLIENPNEEYEVNVKMPEFTIESTHSLVEVLQKLGVNKVFTDLAELTEMYEEDVQKVNKIIQKAKIEVDKEGTTAASATAITTLKATGIATTEPKEKDLYLNRPFAFLIYDAENNEILFSGKVVNMK